MGNKLAKRFSFQVRSLGDLEGKAVALDVSPWFYTGLYSVGNRLTDGRGSPTGPLYLILNYLVSLIRAGLVPVVCFDDRPPGIKNAVLLKRKQERSKKLQELSELKTKSLLDSKGHKLLMMHDIVNNKENMLAMVEKLKEVLGAAGIAYIQKEYFEAQKLGVALKRTGVVDQVISPDRDVLLYGAGVISKIDFRAKTYTYYSFEETLYNLNLEDLEELQYCAIATGTDYSKGMSGVGPVAALKGIKLKGKKAFRQELEREVPNLEEIVNYLNECQGYDALTKGSFDPIRLRNLLIDLNFSPARVSSLLLAFGPRIEPYQLHYQEHRLEDDR